MNKIKKIKYPFKYDLGGFVKDLSNIGLNELKATGDIGLSAVGANNVIPDSSYKGNSANFFKGESQIGGSIAKAALPLALSAVGVPPMVTSMGQKLVTNNINPQDSNQPYYAAEGGQVPQKTINVEKNELETKNGKIIKDFKSKPKHPEDKTKIDPMGNVVADVGNMIIPSDMRDKYMEGDKLTRTTMEANLRKDQNQRDKDIEDHSGNVFSNGGEIYIKPKNRGKFTEAANRAGKSVQEYASQILAHKGNYSSTLVKRANFAHNAAGFKHEDGGMIKRYDQPPYEVGQGEGFDYTGWTNSDRADNNPLAKPAKTNFGYDSPPPSGVNWNNVGYNALVAAPSIYDLSKGIFDKPVNLNANDYQNPYENQVKSLLANRSINMNPVQQKITSERNVALGNANNASGGNSGAYLSNAAQISANTQDARANADMQAQDYNNRYRGEEANTLGALGDRRASMNLAIKNADIQAQMKRSDYLSKGLQGVSSIAQNNSKMNNEGGRDNYLLHILPELFPDFNKQNYGNIYNYKQNNNSLFNR